MALFGRSTAHRKVERLIRDGVGVREACWPIDAAGSGTADALVDDVIGWVRSSMGAMRRPYGIDHVALALAARDEGGRVVCSNSLGVLRPGSFYADEGAEQVRAFLGDASRAMHGRPGEMVGALLSLGDIAFELNARAA
ncbi:MAG: hypothetical protein IPI33_05250 [Dehalococcoidia bacterium]|jgi:hypothetical protein|uniref:hypothetical protein n=1 Tax=Candidatus Amarobacter glycogenicus TaxID=3140699 RepID=UPI001D4564C6|nr:hypothetical protein [Dehalococcoidia bacterium]MBK6562206.1 hypothetical protein [Dehalococcoidia bacterium]MBK7124598.1 hypothetical protein [Dehalococcoidia bacterium]MBK7724649.1 hypothetical protein [Dehalococcoidia bacterium]MBK8561277.1 hypothetical protein [Dehalococcoidia bacterium]